MTQSNGPAEPAGERLGRLRTALAEAGVTGLIVPHADEHQSEYLPPSAERLAWLTGFTGSAGTAIVLAGEAAVFVDGRYTLQAAAQVDPAAFTVVPLAETSPTAWLAAKLAPGDRIAYDPWLLTVAEVRRFADTCREAGAELVALADNPVDRVWEDRPAPPLGPVSLHPLDLAGEDAAAKIARLQASLAEAKADATVVSHGDAIAWIFNVRGTDIAHNPVPLAYAILPATGRPSLFIDGRKLSNAVRATLADLADISETGTMAAAFAGLGGNRRRVLLDVQSTPAAIATAITEAGGIIVERADPVALPRARKNAAELAGTRKAHIRDGAAMVRFLAWLDREAPKGGLDELGAVDRLAAFRAETARQDGSELVDLSFDTISGAGPNGAIVHYRATPATNRRIEPGTLYLVDSGGQYRDGTTDITRTVAIGTPTAEMRDRFTRVLKGHIAVATLRFPKGTTGVQIDPFARAALWQAGLDYDHGTGHGVGAFLSVHEGPVNLSKRGTVPLEPGIILSDEPGYYRSGAYGIRIENLLVVTEAADIPGGDRPMLGFETLTFAPIDRRLIEVALLSPAERAWLDAYHARLPGLLGHLLDDGERAWLAGATQPLGAEG